MSTTDFYFGGQFTSHAPIQISGVADCQGSLEVTSGGSVNTPGVLTIHPGALVTLHGSGSISVGQLNINNNFLDGFVWTGGTLAFTNTPTLTLNSSSVLGTSLSLTSGKNLSTNGTLDVPAGSDLTIVGGTLTSPWLAVHAGGDVHQTSSGGQVNLGGFLLADGPGSCATYSMVGGTLTMNGSNEFVGYSGCATFSQSGGTNTCTSPYNNSSPFILGFLSGAHGTYSLSGGTLNTSSVDPNYSSMVGFYGRGTFTQTGGTHHAKRLAVVNTPDGASTYTLSSGQLTTDDQVWLAGALTQTGGSASVGSYMLIAPDHNYPSSYSLSDAASSLTVGWNEYLGESGAGTFTQTAGTHTINGTLVAGHLAGSHGTFDLQGGSLTTFAEGLGDGGPATITQSGTSSNHTSLLYVGGQAGIESTYTMDGGSILVDNTPNATVGELIGAGVGTGRFTQNGGTHAVTSNLWLSHDPGSRGHFTLNNGTLTVGGGNEVLGAGTLGSFTQNGGTNTINSSLYLGLSAGGTGEYFMHGGTLNTWDIRTDSGIGTFTMDGGTVNFTGHWIRAGINPGSVANYEMTGGTVTNSSTGRINVGEYGTGTLHLGGTAVVNCANDYSSLTFGVNRDANGNHGVGSVLIDGNARVNTWDLRTDSGEGYLNQNGGTIDVSGWMVLGANSGGVSTYTLTSGNAVLHLNGFLGAGGDATLNLQGGTMSVGYDFIQGDSATTGAGIGTGTTSMIAGTLSVDGNEYFGNNGTGVFNQSGGTHTLTGLHGGINVGGTVGSVLRLGQNTGSHGTYNLSGTGVLSSRAFESIGMFGTGAFAQSGGSNSMTYGLWVGDASSGVGTYTLSGGSLSVGVVEYIGFSGQGTFTQTAGGHAVGSAIYIANNAGSTGAFNLQGAYPASSLSTPYIFNKAGGTLIVGGNATQGSNSLRYYQYPGSTLRMQIYGNGAGSFGSLHTIVASLNGTLTLEAMNGFTPALNESFDLITGAISGHFSQVNLPCGWRLQYGPTYVRAVYSCKADYDCSGTISVSDLFAFLTAWFNTDPAADFNGVNGVSVSDLFDFLAQWFAGC